VAVMLNKFEFVTSSSN